MTARAVEPFYRSEEEKAELRPRLEALSDLLCQTQAFILQALKDAGLTVVLLAKPPRICARTECDLPAKRGSSQCANHAANPIGERP